MTDDIEFYYDFGSPNAYLVHHVLPGLVAPFGVRVRYCPILLGGVFKATNNQAPALAFGGIKGKMDYVRVEFARFVERHAVPFSWNPHFPVNTLALMRAAVFAQGAPWEAAFINRAFDAMWREGIDMSNPDHFKNALQAADIPVSEISDAIQEQEVKTKLADVTSAAVARGLFGAPSVFWRGEQFFGKDALSDLEWRLRSA